MIRVGTSGYRFADWKGAFYPKGMPDKDALRFYAEHFNLVEINATYYRILPAKRYEGMLAVVPDGFDFVVKAYGGLTHESGIDQSSLKEYMDSLTPLREGGRLLNILFQYPYSFKNTEDNRRKVLSLCEAVGTDCAAVEFRHDGWNLDAVRDLLQRNGVTWCAVDEPALPGLLPPEPHTTTETGYVRLHGRNKQDWYGGNRELRYKYNYSDEELLEWTPKIRKMEKKTKETLVFFNNCYHGNAPKNALRLVELLRQD
jgi:uncharacterized protein YecE (DUF72 family)